MPLPYPQCRHIAIRCNSFTEPRGRILHMTPYRKCHRPKPEIRHFIGRGAEILTERQRIKRETIEAKCLQHRKFAA